MYRLLLRLLRLIRKNMNSSTIKIGTRGSQLALWQANWVRDRLLEKQAGLQVDIIVIKTKGDKILDVPLAKIGGKGLFVKEIEEALFNQTIDLAVHSLKDMPGKLPEGLCIGAVPLRENPCDAFISRDNIDLYQLPAGARLGTSSLRRSSQLLHLRPDIEIVPLRGNIDTRLNKLDNGEMEAIILAAAGLTRLGLAHRISQYLDQETILPAVAQGALCLETRTDDQLVGSLVSSLNHRDSEIAITAERAFLQRLDGGCQVPIAAHAQIKNQEIVMDGLVAALDGKKIIKKSITGPVAQAAELGRELAEKLLTDGADQILETLLKSEEAGK